MLVKRLSDQRFDYCLPADVQFLCRVVQFAQHWRGEVRSLARVRQQARWGTLKARTITPDRMPRLQEQHPGIVAALRDRDQAQAHTLLRKHLLQVRQYMFGE